MLRTSSVWYVPLVAATADDNVNPLCVNPSLKYLMNDVNWFAELAVGYSQSISTPSNPYLSTTDKILFARLLHFASVFVAFSNAYWHKLPSEYDQPPTAISTFVPLLWAALIKLLITFAEPSTESSTPDAFGNANEYITVVNLSHWMLDVISPYQFG